MKDFSSTIRPAASRQKRSFAPVILTLVLALLCIGGMELAFCYHFSPPLFRQITDPVVQPVQRAINSAKDQIELWKFQQLCRGVTTEVISLSKDYRHPRPVLLPEPAQIVIPVSQASAEEAEPAVTEFIQEGGHTILTGGAVHCVYYNQSDPEWRDQLYGSDPIGQYGCGPTAMSIVVSSMAQQAMDPAQMAAWAYGQGYWCAGSGSYPSIVEGASNAFGLVCKYAKNCDAASLYSHLCGGGMAVALVGPGHFTKSGHFIVLHGATLTGKVLAADPNSRENSLTPWDPQLILDEAAASSGDGSQIWLISKKPVL